MVLNYRFLGRGWHLLVIIRFSQGLYVHVYINHSQQFLQQPNYARIIPTTERAEIKRLCMSMEDAKKAVRVKWLGQVH